MIAAAAAADQLASSIPGRPCTQAEALEEEIHKLKELSHPNVVKFLDALPVDKELYIVTECTPCSPVGSDRDLVLTLVVHLSRPGLLPSPPRCGLGLAGLGDCRVRRLL